jgi:flavin-dependent dehydrogenase
VLLLDREAYGSDTLSTHALMRTGVQQLHKWGLLDRIASADTPGIRGTSFHYGDHRIDIEIRDRHGVDALYSPRRGLLDRTLVDAAREAGAECHHDTRVLELLRTGTGRVLGVVMRDERGQTRHVHAPIVIGADGTRSLVARSVSARPYRIASHCTAAVYSYWPDLELDANHWYYAPGISAGAIPTTGGLTCIFVLVPPERFRREFHRQLERGFDAGLREVAPVLAAQISQRDRAGALRGFTGMPGFLRPCWGPGWALVGDAGYFKDPCSAHGISDALRDAELLTTALIRAGESGLQSYQEERDRLSRRFFDVTESIASFQWSLDEIQHLHREMAEELTREERAMASLSAPFGIAS